MAEMDYSKGSPFGFTQSRYVNYNTALNVYNLKPKHLRKTRAALARVRAGSGFFTLSTMGDSTVVGLALTNPAIESWPAQLKKNIVNSGIPSAGTGIVPCWTNTVDPRWNYGPWASLNPNSSIRKNQAGTAITPMVFTSEEAGTIARVYYTNGSSPFTVSIDGGAPVTVPSPMLGSVVTYYEVTGLANTTHTISIGKINVSDSVFIHGAEVRASATSGIILYNAGISGLYATSLSKASFTIMNFAVAENPSDLIIIRCQTNNTGNTTDDIYRQDINKAISDAKSGGADVVLVTSVPSNGKDFSNTTRILYEMADFYDIPLVDHLDRWGDFTTANTFGYMSDALHPTKLGYVDEGYSIFKALGF
jgi:hypothetical protein